MDLSTVWGVVFCIGVVLTLVAVGVGLAFPEYVDDAMLPLIFLGGFVISIGWMFILPLGAIIAIGFGLGKLVRWLNSFEKKET